MALAQSTNENVREKQAASFSPRSLPVWRQIINSCSNTESYLAILLCESRGNLLVLKVTLISWILPSFRRKRRILDAGPSQDIYIEMQVLPVT